MTNLLFLDSEALKVAREEFRSGKPQAVAALAETLAEADALLPQKIVTPLDKLKIAPSGNRQDYYAIGKYAWPNPDTADGLPYIRRDCEINPESLGPAYDKGAYDDTLASALTLALAWFFAGNPAHADAAARRLRAWFVAPETRMNPHFQFSAALPGVHDGAHIGLIDGVLLVTHLDAARLLEGSPGWRESDRASLQEWLRRYADWLRDSEFGKLEEAKNDNHGLWYDAQLASCALFADDAAGVRAALASLRRRLDTQIHEDGSLPAELLRGRSLLYSRFALTAAVIAVRCGDLIGEDLWHYRTETGRGLELAFNFMAPYLAQDLPWAWPAKLPAELAPAASADLLYWPAKIYQTDLLTGAWRRAEALAEPRPPGAGLLRSLLARLM